MFLTRLLFLFSISHRGKRVFSHSKYREKKKKRREIHQMTVQSSGCCLEQGRSQMLEPLVSALLEISVRTVQNSIFSLVWGEVAVKS